MSQATLGELPYRNSNLFAGYYLNERVTDREEWDCDAEAESVFEELQQLYDDERGLVNGYNEDPLIDNWISEVLKILGFGTQVETTLPEGDGYVDVLLFEDESRRREAASVYLDTEETTDLFERGLGLVEAKQWDADFEARFSEHRPYHNASQQIKRYLSKTPENIQWGILTNGRKWRLYGTKDYETQTYYEVDLPELLEHGGIEAFKYFYVFFRPEAFREVGGETFLDSVWSESETAAQELGEDLQDNVFTALRVLGRGFLESNDLDINPDDQESLDELKEQSLVLLYRLMFILYAESRGLIHPEDPAAVSEYEENFSLDALRLQIHEEIGEVDEGFDAAFSEYSTTYWSRLEDLFSLIDEGEESLGIPPYNGGLFDHEKHEFLAENEVSNRHLAEVIYRLSTTENENGRYVLADYADLDTRHLGSVYEGLLEHQFEIASEDYAAVAEDGGQVWKPATEVTVADAVETVPEGGLYVVNDEGERKATGAYYTPDYVVTYIVEETVGPLVEEIREDLVEQGFEPGTQEYLGPFLRRVTDLKILDPAMGSGHFLTRATGFLTERVMDEIREVESEMGAAFDEQHVRREIAKECIYGVDINGMAVELAKLSMWLETLAADRPLAFLDHHLKTGNSLVGSDVTEVLSEDAGDDGGQLTLTQALARVRQDTLEHVMDLMEELLAIDNETLEDVQSMEEIYKEIRADPLYQRLFELTNVHTAERFGLDIPEGAYEEMAGAIESESEWAEIQEADWFKSAQATAEEEGFFHWELEYPAAFFGDDGRKLTGSGFDAVIGNPPYVGTKNIEDDLQRYLESSYTSTTGRWDLYTVFTEIGLKISADTLSFIQPTMFMRRSYGQGLREYVSRNAAIRNIVDLSEVDVFDGAINYTCIFTASPKNLGDSDEFSVYTPFENHLVEIQTDDMEVYSLHNSDLNSDPWPVIPPSVVKIIESIPSNFLELGEFTESISEGIHTGYNEAFFIKKSKAVEKGLEDELLRPMLKGKDIEKYIEPDTSLQCVYPYDESGEVIPPSQLQSEFPNVWEHLCSHRDDLENRTYVLDSGKYWYEIWCERTPGIFSNPKILTPDIAEKNKFTLDYRGVNNYFNTKIKSIKLDTNSINDYLGLLGLLNSKLIEHIYRGIAPPKKGGFRSYKPGFLSQLKVPSSSLDHVAEKAEEILSLNRDLKRLNLALLDHLGSYSDGQTLSDIGLTQPPEGAADSILQKTTEDHPNLRVGTCEVVRESPTSVEIRLTARYKPDDEDGETRPKGGSRTARTGEARESVHETDQWGYTETELLPALEIADLSETEADLIEHFVPVAVDEAGGFAEFRETATKTNSLVDRLRKLTLPAVDEVAEGLESYIETKERAEELDAKIEKTDQLIDEIVYELYGLTEEEIEIVEESVRD
ncbi:Eco57I restriction-modification methylase domain-containing protein [Natronomonas amylolytica]|uniref:Eco57I restriction-modification methylase domain-containing protein n=1 Tax=Natronomonas amylolytica TaxID=3108498 RepID=UPI003AB6B62A